MYCSFFEVQIYKNDSGLQKISRSSQSRISFILAILTKTKAISL
ncbi:hypothetical protein IMCC3317_47170 [Kordia antarctica]|uniref:Uncharacterized protein n=1 Tax=Kordia antarctica TaxID=1218801 RepID=A0A7L4ZS57_9FLAO|nr:hypothetical protein IMCC3317_47170 [Kordia antarctica]